MSETGGREVLGWSVDVSWRHKPSHEFGFPRMQSLDRDFWPSFFPPLRLKRASGLSLSPTPDLYVQGQTQPTRAGSMSIPDPAWKVRSAYARSIRPFPWLILPLEARPCPFYAQGRCIFGNACSFLHDVPLSASLQTGASRTAQNRPETPQGPEITVHSPRSVKSPPRSPRLKGLIFALKDIIGEEDDEDESDEENDGEVVVLATSGATTVVVGELSNTADTAAPTSRTGTAMPALPIAPPTIAESRIAINRELLQRFSGHTSSPANAAFSVLPVPSINDDVEATDSATGGLHHTLGDPEGHCSDDDSNPDSDDSSAGSSSSSDGSPSVQSTVPSPSASLASLDSPSDPTISARLAHSPPTLGAQNLLSPVTLSSNVFVPFPLLSFSDSAVHLEGGTNALGREDSMDSGYAERWPSAGSHFLLPMSPPRSPGPSSTFDLLSSPFGSPSSRLLNAPISPQFGPVWRDEDIPPVDLPEILKKREESRMSRPERMSQIDGVLGLGMSRSSKDLEALTNGRYSYQSFSSIPRDSPSSTAGSEAAGLAYDAHAAGEGDSTPAEPTSVSPIVAASPPVSPGPSSTFDLLSGAVGSPSARPMSAPVSPQLGSPWRDEDIPPVDLPRETLEEHEEGQMSRLERMPQVDGVLGLGITRSSKDIEEMTNGRYSYQSFSSIPRESPKSTAGSEAAGLAYDAPAAHDSFVGGEGDSPLAEPTSASPIVVASPMVSPGPSSTFEIPSDAVESSSAQLLSAPVSPQLGLVWQDEDIPQTDLPRETLEEHEGDRISRLEQTPQVAGLLELGIDRSSEEVEVAYDAPAAYDHFVGDIGDSPSAEPPSSPIVAASPLFSAPSAASSIAASDKDVVYAPRLGSPELVERPTLIAANFTSSGESPESDSAWPLDDHEVRPLPADDGIFSDADADVEPEFPPPSYLSSVIEEDTLAFSDNGDVADPDTRVNLPLHPPSTSIALEEPIQPIPVEDMVQDEEVAEPDTQVDPPLPPANTSITPEESMSVEDTVQTFYGYYSSPEVEQEDEEFSESILSPTLPDPPAIASWVATTMSSSFAPATPPEDRVLSPPFEEPVTPRRDSFSKSASPAKSLGARVFTPPRRTNRADAPSLAARAASGGPTTPPVDIQLGSPFHERPTAAAGGSVRSSPEQTKEDMRTVPFGFRNSFSLVSFSLHSFIIDSC